MNDQMKLIALEIMFGKFSMMYENIERQVPPGSPPSEKLRLMLSNLKSYAAKRRWEAQIQKGKREPARR